MGCGLPQLRETADGRCLYRFGTLHAYSQTMQTMTEDGHFITAAECLSACVAEAKLQGFSTVLVVSGDHSGNVRASNIDFESLLWLTCPFHAE